MGSQATHGSRRDLHGFKPASDLRVTVIHAGTNNSWRVVSIGPRLKNEHL